MAKIAAYMKHKAGPKVGYVLAYTEAQDARRKSILEDRLSRWAEPMAWKLVGSQIGAGPDAWRWGIGLFRSPASH
jgi:hypothetical protein